MPSHAESRERPPSGRRRVFALLLAAASLAPAMHLVARGGAGRREGAERQEEGEDPGREKQKKGAARKRGSAEDFSAALTRAIDGGRANLLHELEKQIEQT